MVLITGHCSSFDIKIMYVSQKLNGLNNYESVKMNVSRKHFKVLFILFKSYFDNKRNT